MLPLPHVLLHSDFQLAEIRRLQFVFFVVIFVFKKYKYRYLEIILTTKKILPFNLIVAMGFLKFQPKVYGDFAAI